MSTLEALRFVLDDARTPKSFATTSSTRCSTRCATDRCSPRRKSNGWRSGTTRLPLAAKKELGKREEPAIAAR